ncbi:hypothetical protein ZTR_10442 [Talaromyces verruculosus]|nr:hypothetical protein ZTR_10442 [Talaromyces verruculosus]
MAGLVLDYLIRRDSIADPNNDPNIGSSRGNASSTSGDVVEGLTGGGSTSNSALVSTLLPALVIAGFWFGLFLVCRRNQQRWYSPRSHLPNLHHHERSPELPRGFINWFGAFFQISDSHVLHHSSLDGYLFLRFLRNLCIICFAGIIILWPVLLPVHATGGAGNSQMDQFSFSNVTNPAKYYAHAVMGMIYFTYVFFVITRESLFYANLRQTYLNSPAYVNRISSRTVLFMSVPESYKSEKKLRQVFGDSICRVWITSDCKELKKKVGQRDKLAYRLERAEIKLLRGANAARLKAEATKEKSGFNVCDDCELADPLTATKIKRPMHRANFFGKKVDSIQYYRSRLAVAIKEVEELQQKHRDGDAKYLTAVFVEFKTQSDAQVALQTLSHHQPMHMTPRYSGIAPREVIWSSLNLSWWQRIIRMFVVQGGIASLIIFWSVPAAIVGTISNVTYLANLIPFLGWLGHLPGFIEGVITGLLPSAALILLMSLVPPICRLCARKAGLPSLSRVELFAQSAHFCFQVVQVFLVTTITSAASAALTGLSWGSILPVFTNMGVIALTYSCIAPLILAFAFIGLFLVYQAYRYNLLFVYDLNIDTKGLIYPRALQHLLTGVYLAEICMIGLFSIKAAVGPLIIMAFYTILTILAHVSLNDMLRPLMNFLPRSLDTEEEEIQMNQEAAEAYRHAVTRHGRIWKWFHPNLYRDYADLRRKVRRDHIQIKYSEKELADAYYEPCITAETPRLWIPRDPGGLSQEEIRHTSAIIPISDHGAHLDAKNKIRWNKDDEDLHMWERRVLY